MAQARARLVRATAVGVAAALLGVGVVVPQATAEPNKTIEQVEAELEVLEHRAESASEAFNGAQVKHDEIQRKVEAVKKQVGKAKAKLRSTQQAVGQIAASAYRSGGLDSSLQLLLVDDPDEFLQQAAALDQVVASQNTVLRRTQTDRLQLAQATAKLTEMEKAAQAAVDEMAAAKKEIDAAVQDQKDLLAKLQEEERRRLEELARQRAAAAAEAARQAAARAAEAARGSRADVSPSTSSSSSSSSSDSSSSSTSSSSSSSSDSGSSGDGGSVPVSSRAGVAVSTALAQLGEPYSYSASPPNSWDCSKLVAYAWGAAGVSLTAYSYAMAGQVRRISTSELQPGDILFYFNGAHHVAMYIGGGQIVEASSPRTGVRVTSLWNSWSSAHFSFAGRP
ncbi:MAG: NlpC/P60 family protein [Candidatus Nanopelagicales bacterium]